MRMIDADALYRRVKAECNPYGKPSIGWEDGKRMMEWIEHAPTVGETTRPVFNGRFWECEECGQRYKDILVAKEYKHCPGCGRKIERWY